MRKTKTMWSPICVTDECGIPEFWHIVPVIEAPSFDTLEEAQAFLKKLLDCGEPCLVNERDEVVYTYFGHTLSRNCICEPEISDKTTIIHRQAQ